MRIYNGLLYASPLMQGIYMVYILHDHPDNREDNECSQLLYSVMANTSISCGYSHFLCYSPLDINAINTPNYKMLFTFQFHWKTDQKIQNFNREEADEMAKNDPDFSIRDLYNSIADGKLPSWTL